MVSAWDNQASSTTAYNNINLAVGSSTHKHLCGYKYNFIAGGGTLQDLTALFCSMLDPTLPAEEELVVNSGTGASLTTMACPAGQRVTAVQYGHGPMSSTSVVMAVAPVADGGLGIPVTPSGSSTTATSGGYIDGPECPDYTASEPNYRLMMTFE